MARRKTCTKCGKKYPDTEKFFYRGSRGTLNTACKRCMIAAQRARLNTENGRAVYRASHLKRKFGITAEEYDAMLAAQGGVCAICGGPEPTGRSLALDHCHDSGLARGLLCTTCNMGLGRVSDSQERIYHLINYIDKHKAQQAM